MLQDNQPLGQLPQLPADVLARVLSFVPLQQRLGSCSLASRSMHAAAAAAPLEIQTSTFIRQTQADALCYWLQRHSTSTGVKHSAC